MNSKTVVITPEEVAERWNIDVTTVYKYVNTGILRRVSRIGAVRILLEDVEKLEDNPNDKSRTHKERQLERKLQEKDKEIQMLKSILAKYQMIGAEASMYLINNEK